MVAVPKEIADRIKLVVVPDPRRDLSLIISATECPRCKYPITALLGGSEERDFVYFIQRQSDGAVKIGLSKDPWKRLIALSRGNRATVLAVILGSRDAERGLHVRFAHRRIEGEWFLPDDDMMRFIGALPINAFTPKEA